MEYRKDIGEVAARMDSAAPEPAPQGPTESVKPALHICGWMKLYHPKGALVTLPVILGTPEEMFRGVGDYLDAGFLVEAPGLEVGEMKEDVGWVSRSVVEGRTGPADHISFYSTNESWTKPFLTTYLNTDADRNDFEAATGVKPSSIPEYIGEGRLERGNKKTDHLVVKLPRPATLVMKPNPRYVVAEADAAKAANKVYKVPKKVFVRWHGVAAATKSEWIDQGQIQVLVDLMNELIKAGDPIKEPARFYKWAANNDAANDLSDIPVARYQAVKDFLDERWRKAKAKQTEGAF